MTGAAFLMLIACVSLIPPTSAPTAMPLPSLTPTDTATVPPSATPTQTPSPIITDPQVIVLADGLAEPDDLLLAPDGSIYLSDVGDGTNRRYTQSGGLALIHSGLN